MADRRPTLATLLGRGGRETTAALLAALHDARGATVSREGRLVDVDGRRHLVVASGTLGRLRDRLRASDPGHVDVVVAADDERASRLADRYGASACSAADLDRLARYGVERPVADDIFERQFGHAVDAVAPLTRRRERLPAATGATSGRHPTAATAGSGRRVDRPNAWSALVLIVGVALLVSAVGTVPATLDRQAPIDIAGSSSTQTAPPTADERSGTETAAADASADRPTPGAERGLAPGLTKDGVTDARALASAHAAVLGNQSYRWTLRYVETDDGEITARATETVLVAESSIYTSNVTRVGTVRGPTFVGTGPADDDVGAHPRFNPDVGDEPAAVGPADRQRVRSTQMLETLLRTQHSTVVQSVLGDRRLYVVDFRGWLSPGIEHYWATAHITPSGFVPYLTASYCLHPAAVSALDDRPEDAATSPSVCVTFTMHYTDVGTTTVEEPPWAVGTRA